MKADVARLKADAVNQGLVFSLTYYTDKGPRDTKVFMVHHRDWQGDDFIVRDAESCQVLGAGDTKEDAEQDARIRLHQRDDFGIPV